MQQIRNEMLTARSVIASLLLGMRPPRLAGLRLVRAAGRFGYTENAARVALSRMVAAGELDVIDGTYALAGRLLDRHARQEAGRHAAPRPWDRTWLLAVQAGPARDATQRAADRKALAAARLGEWREGVWVRPDNLDGPRPDLEGCVWITGARPDPVPAAEELWDLAGWAAAGEALLAAMAGTDPSGADPEPAFLVAAAVVRHLRDDPLLPSALLPDRWPGARLRVAYDAYEAAFQTALRPVLLGLA
jgi:phenylacetic acid degradation operon negative regulatory protein